MLLHCLAPSLATGAWTRIDMMRPSRLLACVLSCLAAPLYAANMPNIVLIYADDLGYGDLSCYGAEQIKTPNIDRLAEQGLRFTDAHSPSATCTPSRYALLTGEYAWRRKGTGILRGNAPAIIRPGRITMPSVLKKAGYTTAAVGKWHLGLGDKDMDWNGEIKPGPLEIGFDYCFLIPATGDRVPCVYVENHRVVDLDPGDPIHVDYDTPIPGQPTGKDNPELLKLHPSHGHDQAIVNGISRIGYMSGGKSALWTDETMADTITGKAIGFIEKNQDRPFFLYFATHDIHVPRVPHPRFAGKSGMGARGDVVLQFDDSVGRIVEALERLKLADNTIVIVSSDNGPVVDDGYRDEAVAKLGNHKPAGAWRGGKYSNFEGGTRVPFIVRWPQRVKPGVSKALFCQVDLLASFAALTGQTLDKNDAPDSMDNLACLLGTDANERNHLVEHAGALSLRERDWKYIPPNTGPRRSKATNTELGNDAEAQLYNLADDPGETRNLSTEEPDRAREMKDKLEKIRNTGRSRD